MTKINAREFFRERLKKARRVVLKAGTSILTRKSGHFSNSLVASLGRAILALRQGGREIVLVSSGAIALGMETLGLEKRPRELKKLQACAAVGQGKLMRAYETFFSKRGVHTAQILLTRDGLENRGRFRNARHTLEEILALGALPIVNENDTVATEEITFGDNDLLSTWLANVIQADLVILLSDVDGFYLKDGSRIGAVQGWGKIKRTLYPHVADQKKERSVGGMRAKLEAARLALRSNIPLLLVNGHDRDILQKVFRGEDVGTLFIPSLKRRIEL